jgi:hypothetical protein
MLTVFVKTIIAAPVKMWEAVAKYVQGLILSSHHKLRVRHCYLSPSDGPPEAKRDLVICTKELIWVEPRSELEHLKRTEFCSARLLNI